MKIEKEVLLPVSVDEVWPWLIDVDKLQAVWSYGPGSDASISKPKLSRIPREIWKIIDSKPLQKISFSVDKLPPSIITSFELSKRGRRTSLKVVIEGWESVNQDKAQQELPRLSMEWENRLNLLKEAICANLKNHITIP